VTRTVFAIPGDLATHSGGYGYDRELIRQLPACGIDVRHLALPDGFPFPDPAALDAALASIVAVDDADLILVDGLAMGVLPIEGLARASRPLLALVHHPLALETGLSAAQADALRASERAALRMARHVIATSETTAETLARDYGVDPTRIMVALPGIMPVLRTRGSGGDAVHLLAVGAVIARKAYDVLVVALAGLADLPWRVTIVGSLDRDPERVEALRRQIVETGLAERITLAGELSDEALEQVYAMADLFVLPSLYEGYGMVLGEAMARGLPIVTSTGGAAAHTVPDGAAVKVPPGDAAALADALREVIADSGLRQRLAAAAWGASQTLPSWTECAQRVASALRSVARSG
jgi:glycosyltransferase involved in cell wall biosynthesis